MIIFRSFFLKKTKMKKNENFSFCKDFKSNSEFFSFFFIFFWRERKKMKKKCPTRLSLDFKSWRRNFHVFFHFFSRKKMIFFQKKIKISRFPWMSGQWFPFFSIFRLIKKCGKLLDLKGFRHGKNGLGL